MSITKVKVTRIVWRPEGPDKFVFILANVARLAVWLTIVPITHQKHDPGISFKTSFFAVAIHHIFLTIDFRIACNDRVLTCITAV